MKRLLIVGAGGFGREMLGWVKAIPIAERNWEVAGFLDANARALDGFAVDYPILGDPAKYVPLSDEVFICAIGDPATKLRVCCDLKTRGARFATIIHPAAVVGPGCIIGEGCILCPGAIVTANVMLGRFVTLNVYATVGHDAVLGEGCTLSGHTDVTGFCRLGEGVFMGSHAAALPRAVVGDYAVIGGGSVVLRRVRPHSTVMGVPAKQIAGFAS
jgi:sugar O-acyltransferase (sialic acid O-acetyltransferase NeuD family)